MRLSAKQIYQPVTPIQSGLNHFLVCGLGSLGQYCAKILKEFNVNVRAIDKLDLVNWEIPELADLLDDLLIGDCRQTQVLARAKVQQCQVILLVTNDEQVNIQAAFAARLLNPQIRLVIRSGKQNLNQLLSQNLAFRPWLLKVEKAIAMNSLFEGATTIARISGCPLAMASKIMENLPAMLPKSLYNHQAHRLVRELGKVQVTARLIPVDCGEQEEDVTIK